MTTEADREIFVDLYPALRRFAAVVGPLSVDPDDLVQEALARRLALGSLAQLDHPGKYLRRAILNLANNKRRSLRRGAAALVRLPTASGSADQYPSDLADLTALTPRQRAALYLHHVEGWPFADIAHHLGCTEPAARKAASRGRQLLTEHLTEDA